MRRAMPKPCCGPRAWGVLRTMRSRGPWRTSDFSVTERFPLDIAKEGSGAPLECPYERRRSARKVPFRFGKRGGIPPMFLQRVGKLLISGALQIYRKQECGSY